MAGPQGSGVIGRPMLPQPAGAINAASRSVYHAAAETAAAAPPHSATGTITPRRRRRRHLAAAHSIFINVTGPPIPTVNDADSTILQHRSRTGRYFTNSIRPPIL